MITSEHNTKFRRASIADCSHIVRLYSLASNGVANYVWSTMAKPGQNLEEVGLRRYQREDIVYSYLNCMIAEVNGQVAGMMLSYPMHSGADQDYSDCDPVLLPYARLQLDNSFYISGMAVYQQYRSKGIASRFLSMAEQHALQQGYKKLSLIVMEENTGAYNLYLKNGFHEVMRENIVPHPLIYCRRDALLMVRDLSVS